MSDNPSWAWLGLLKWTLAYTDGTTDTKPQEMSAEDKAFLEDVMKNGIINEGERMREILKELTCKIIYTPVYIMIIAMAHFVK